MNYIGAKRYNAIGLEREPLAVKNCAYYVALAKSLLGDRASDKRLGEELGYAQPTVAEAKAGQMSQGFALALGDFLVKKNAIDHAGEVMLVAHAESRSGRARATLMDYLKKIAGSGAFKSRKRRGDAGGGTGCIVPAGT